MFNEFSATDWAFIAPVIVIMGMSKGGFPVSGVALPLLILLWPEKGESARSAVSFMLPLLCLMDLCGAWFYRKKANWREIFSLLPGTIIGILVASLFFVMEGGLSVTDKTLKLLIGSLGLIFTFWNLFGRRLFSKHFVRERRGRSAFYGFLAGISSTIAHAGGPVMQMNLLPKGWTKERFAATTVYYFLILNALKLIPFSIAGRFNSERLLYSATFIPLIPVGVICGVLLVRVTKEAHYRLLIQSVLLITSIILIYKAVQS